VESIEYQLTRNDAGTDYRHHVHGGHVSFDRLNWNTSLMERGVVFSVLSPDGSEVKARYLLFPASVLTYHSDLFLLK
jgi:galactose mutarotase-like enzyme